MNDLISFPCFSDQRIVIKKETYSSDCIERLIQTISIGVLMIELSGTETFHQEVFDLAKKLDHQKTFVKKLWICETDRFPFGYKEGEQLMCLRKESYSSDCIERLIYNVSIGVLIIKLSGSETFHREVFDLARKLDHQELEIESLSFPWKVA